MVATLHFIYGPPGAGKTSLALELADRHSALAVIEDEWLLRLNPPITNIDEFIAADARARSVIGPLATRLLSLGVNVVFDFAANTVKHRAWTRSIFEAAGANHVLHVLDVPLEECKRRVRERNRTRPAGLYYGDVAEELVDAVSARIVPPSAAEGFTLA